MATINILKDGTVVKDMSTVTVPKEIMINIYNIFHSEAENQRKGAKNGGKKRI